MLVNGRLHEAIRASRVRASDGPSRPAIRRGRTVRGEGLLHHEILRIVAAQLGEKAIFKGGTSLSKGWGLISRFSEDIDLFVNPESFEPRPGKNKMDRNLKQLSVAVAEHPALEWLRDEGRTIGGLGREDYFAYRSRFGQLPGIRPVVRLEPGIQSGAFPTERLPISSLVAQFVSEQGLGELAEDLTSFEMTLLHFRRTFVEKLFTIHGKVVHLIQEDVPLGRDARHYADLYALAGTPEVRAMLVSPEYDAIRTDYDAKSRKFFAAIYRPPKDLAFGASPALFPDQALREQIAVDYESQCQLLFTGNYPSFDEVCDRFEEIRDLI
jgi:hypothetical protein